MESNTKGVFFIVNTTAEDTSGYGVGNADYLEGFVAEHIEPISSLSDVIVVRGDSSDEINGQLEEVMSSQSYSGVDGLYVLSHGNGGFIPNRTVDEPEKASAYHSNLYNESGRFLVNLSDKNSVAQSFGSLVGRFNPDAHIIIDACKTIADGSAEVKLERMERVAGAFGLEEGALYMSDINNMAFTDLFIRTPFSTERSSLFNNFASLLIQSYSGVTYPVGLGMEWFLRNSGYTMVRDNAGSRLYADTLSHARSNLFPSGEPVAFNTPETVE